MKIGSFRRIREISPAWGFGSPLLRQKRNGRRKKSINTRACEVTYSSEERYLPLTYHYLRQDWKMCPKINDRMKVRSLFFLKQVFLLFCHKKVFEFWFCSVDNGAASNAFVYTKTEKAYQGCPGDPFKSPRLLSGLD